MTVNETKYTNVNGFKLNTNN